MKISYIILSFPNFELLLRLDASPIMLFSSAQILTLSLPLTRICINFSTVYNDTLVLKRLNSYGMEVSKFHRFFPNLQLVDPVMPERASRGQKLAPISMDRQLPDGDWPTSGRVNYCKGLVF